MFEHYTFGMQARPGRRQSRELSPGEVGAAGPQHQCPSPPLSASAVSPVMARREARIGTDSIDSLAQELSRQTLQLDRANLEQLQLQLSSPSPSSRIPYIPPIPPCPDLEIDDEPHPRMDTRCRPPAVPRLLSPDSMQIDQAPIEPDMKRLSRQRSSQFNNNPNNTRTIQTLVEGMIASGSQCNVVHRASPPPLTPTSARRPEPTTDDQIKFDIGCVDLQVDDAYVNGQTPSDAEREEIQLIESMMSLRRAGAPAGVRKMGLLTYRASSDAALSCANVVRSRPRMRKRRGGHRGGGSSSKATSMVSSAFSSPVVPPSLDGASLVALPEI